MVKESELSFPRFNRGHVQQQLARLGSRQQAAFAALCAERLLPYYRWFSTVERWGDYARLRDALGAVWSYVEGQPRAPKEYERLVALCRRLTPDTEDFESPLAARAMDASVAVVQALLMCIEPSERRAAEVAESAVDAAFAIEQLDASEDLGRVRIADRAQLQALFGSDRVKRELETQAAAIEALGSGEDALNVASLRERYGLAS